MHMLTISYSVATGPGHSDYPGHLGYLLCGSKWVLPRHTNFA